MLATLARRIATAGIAGVAALTLFAGSAQAHFCYFTEANVKAELGRAGSSAFMPFGALAEEFIGICPAGAEVLADAAGVSVTTVINIRGTMAGGALKEGRTVQPISHLDFDAMDAVMEDAFAACA